MPLSLQHLVCQSHDGQIQRASLLALEGRERVCGEMGLIHPALCGAPSCIYIQVNLQLDGNTEATLHR